MGYPLAISIGGVGIVIGLLVFGPRIAGELYYGRFYSGLENYVLLAVPLFIFMGTMLEKSRLAEDLLKTIGDCGLAEGSRVVIVGPSPDPGTPPYAYADAVRVAVTLIYGGVRNVAVLAGGHAKWIAEGRPVTTEAAAATPVPYNSPVDSPSWVSTEYVKEHIGKAVLIDGRDVEVYFGVFIEEVFADMRGHIPTAQSLPMIWVWEADGTYKPTEFIAAMAAGVIGDDKTREVIAYCGAGGYASAWWYLLTQLLGYTNVKIYDGSMEAWVDGGNPVVAYSWTE